MEKLTTENITRSILIKVRRKYLVSQVFKLCMQADGVFMGMATTIILTNHQVIPWMIKQGIFKHFDIFI